MGKSQELEEKYSRGYSSSDEDRFPVGLGVGLPIYP